MGARWVGSDGFTVEAITLNGRDILRVTKHGYFIADCDNVEDLCRCGLEIADLAEVILFPTT
jgi:hypothetical protein